MSDRASVLAALAAPEAGEGYTFKELAAKLELGLLNKIRLWWALFTLRGGGLAAQCIWHRVPVYYATDKGRNAARKVNS